MHACAAGGGKADEGDFLLDGGFHAPAKALAYHGADGAAHEVELKARGDQLDAFDGAAHDDQGIGFAGVFQRFFQALRVFAAVFEFEGIDGDDFLADFVAAFAVHEVVQAVAGVDAVVVTAGGADVLIFLQIGFVQHRFAAGTFHPQAFRNLLVAFLGFGCLGLGGQQRSSQDMAPPSI